MNRKYKDIKRQNLIGRREFLALSARYGQTASLLALGAVPIGATLFQATEAIAATEDEKRAKADHTMIIGLTAGAERWPDGPIITESFNTFGFPILKEAIERHSQGKIYVDAHYGGVLGDQVAMAPKVQQGTLAGCVSTTQNIAVAAPVWNVLDVPYAVGSDVNNWWRFLFASEINGTLRKTSEEQGIINLFIFPDLRWLEFRPGLDKDIRLPEDLANLKMRVTGSKGEQLALGILPCSPTPIAWGEVFGAMKDGAIDGLHVSPCSCADAGIHQVVGQMTDTRFMGDSAAGWVSTKWLRKLPPALQEAVLEAGYDASVYGYEKRSAAFTRQCGILPNPVDFFESGERPDIPETSIFSQVPITQNLLTEGEHAAWRDALSFERNREAYDALIDRYGRAEYESIVRVANSDASPEPARWWR